MVVCFGLYFLFSKIKLTKKKKLIGHGPAFFLFDLFSNVL